MSITVKLDSHKIKRLEAFFTSKIYVKEKNKWKLPKERKLKIGVN